MCRDCWERYESPSIVNSQVQECAALIDQLDGSGLHVVIDDMNLEDEHIQDCTDLTEIERRCAELLLSMTLEERLSAIAFHEGWSC